MSEDPPFTAVCTEPEFPDWWARFGKALSTNRRLNAQMRSLAAFSAGALREREDAHKLNTLATEEWADKIACQEALGRLQRERDDLARAVEQLCGDLQAMQADYADASQEVARLRHLAHQLEGYLQHKPMCQALQPDLASGCPQCHGPVTLNDDGDSVFCIQHEFVQFFSVSSFPVGICTCGLAALTEPQP